MATNTQTRSGAAVSIAAVLAALVASVAPNTTNHVGRLGSELDSDEIGLMGNAGHVPDSKKPTLTAYFEQESYRPGDRAQLVVTDTASQVSVQIFHAGGESEPTVPHDVMLGTPVTKIVPVGTVAGRRVLPVTIAGDWPSGVYFAELTAPGSRVGYAPFVLAPRRLGEHRIAVVMPTQTWQAYNFRDDNGDGQPDTWYAGWKEMTARLIRPFLDRGVPPHWEKYDAPFVRWLVQTNRNVDYLSDAELRNVRDGETLANAYSLIVFSGHHEYVTTHEYDVVTRYRDLGGNLAFLAANNFFWKITIKDNVMTRVAEWRDLGRPEAALIGVQYRANDRGGHRGPWLLTSGASATPWLFAGMNLEAGQGFSSGGIEIDATSSASPKGIHIVAEIPNLYGPGFTAQMTYYETPAGARVFAAGAFSLARSVWEPEITTLMTNLWQRLGTP
jgi:N,N-dimethylformamidase beta subunit-like, C-terminal